MTDRRDKFSYTSPDQIKFIVPEVRVPEESSPNPEDCTQHPQEDDRPTDPDSETD